MINEETTMQMNFQDELLQVYSDDELIRLIHASPMSASFSGVFWLSENLVAKHYKLDEFEDSTRATEIAVQLGVRVPDVKRLIRLQQDTYCIMDRIRGPTLEQAWPELGWIHTLRLALQLRRWIGSLRSVTSNVAGSLVTGKCRSFWLEDRYGLPSWASVRDIASFLNFWTKFVSIRNEVQAAKNKASEAAKDLRPSFSPESLVLTHHDLAPRNMLLDTGGSLWLIDWEYSGFYPEFFEYAGMHNFAEFHRWCFFCRMRWYLFTLIAAGRYDRERKLLQWIRSKFTRFSAGRRFELLRNGGPTAKPVS